MANTEHTFLVAVTVEGPKGTSRLEAERVLRHRLPVPGAFAVISDVDVQSWWIAEDDRNDGSDNDSAVFVSRDRQRTAFRTLIAAGLTSPHNNPANQRS